MPRSPRDVRLAVHLPLKMRCLADYEAMPPVTGGRRCEACEHVVHDLSAMTEREAARFVARHAGGPRTCVRYSARPDGTVVYRPDPSRLAPGMLAAALVACTPHEPLPRIDGSSIAVEPAAPVPTAAPVIVPTAPAVGVQDEPDDDINPCPPPLDPGKSPAAKRKKKPAVAKPPERDPDEMYVGFLD